MAARFPPPPSYYTTFASSNLEPPAIPDAVPTVESVYSGSVSRTLAASSRRQTADFSEVHLEIDDTIIRNKLIESFEEIRIHVLSLISPVATDKPLDLSLLKDSMDDFNSLVSRARVVQAREEVSMHMKSELETRTALLASLNQLIDDTESKLINLAADINGPQSK